MNYISDQDIELRLGSAVCVQLTDDAGSGEINAAVLEAARADAEGEVNSYLARRYRVPIDTVSHPEVVGVLRAVTLQIVEYRLYSRRSSVPEDVVERYEMAIKWLEKVADGEVHLPGDSPLALANVTGMVARVAGNEGVFSREGLG